MSGLWTIKSSQPFSQQEIKNNYIKYDYNLKSRYQINENFKAKQVLNNNFKINKSYWNMNRFNLLVHKGKKYKNQKKHYLKKDKWNR
ncbi:hypothetical protein [Spiroplasma chrysopicola]|uniref:Uncharacterized protein n=1 Tax=Spiroplasma chrysopicola DF-1 TaxID=1276227 RepID=R4UC53_9MOLU|nr:hypothetical protein [Spiroplasma chrysopicola]AGM25484.1 hypothetical protein SCHRY_v1c09110 [Spiroplasma chrysopicola DF-1]